MSELIISLFYYYSKFFIKIIFIIIKNINIKNILDFKFWDKSK